MTYRFAKPWPPVMTASPGLMGASGRASSSTRGTSAVGLGTAAVLTRWMENLLYEVSPLDAQVLVATAVLLGGAALAAAGSTPLVRGHRVGARSAPPAQRAAAVGAEVDDQPDEHNEPAPPADPDRRRGDPESAPDG